MTVKLVALWSTPQDEDTFDKDYEGTHMPLVGRLPGLTGAVASKAIDGPYYRMAELAFSSAGDLQSAIGSDAGKELLGDAQRLQDTYDCKLTVLTVEEQSRL